MTDDQHQHDSTSASLRPKTTGTASGEVAAATSPVTVLPLAVPADRTTNLRVIADADQQVDHSHQPVPPVSPGGFPYRYKVRLQGANAYAFTADEVLALFIDGYQSQPGRDREAQLEQVKLRGPTLHRRHRQPRRPGDVRRPARAPPRKPCCNAPRSSAPAGTRSPPTSAPAGTTPTCRCC